MLAEPAEEVRELAKHDPLEHPEQVRGREDHAERRHGGDERAVEERPDEDKELTDEARQAGQPGRSEHEESERQGVDRGDARQAAHLGDRPVMGPLVDDADEQEQAAGGNAVVDDLEDRPIQPLLVEHKDPERHEVHVADRAIRDELLEVGLDEGHDRAVDDRDQAQDDDRRPECLGRRREERQGEPDEPICTELQHHPGEYDRARRRRFDVGVGQSRVEW